MRTVDLDSLYDDQLECWIRKVDAYYILGISDWTQGYIGDIQLINLEVKEGDHISKGDPLAILESNKTTIELNAPAPCIIKAINPDVLTHPSILNKDCYARSADSKTAGWILQVTDIDPTHLSQLLSAAEYEAAVDSFFKKG